MNNAVKVLKLAVAIATALAAHAASAAYSFTGGSLTLTESQEFAAVSDLIGLTFTAPIGSTSTVGQDSTPGSQGYMATWIAQPLTGATFAADGSVMDVLAAGSALTISRGNRFSTFSNFEVDFTSGQILADITTQASSFGRKKLFDISGVSNVATVMPDGSIAVNFGVGAVVVPGNPPSGALDPWILNLIPGDIAAPTGPALFGTASGNVAAAVPEPSTYALLLVGLVGVGALARRRAEAP